ncbi:MAG: type II toxin-antitoxin system HicB family antitoxin [Egibacteraceae bacterium]
MTTYTAHVTRDGRFWLVYVPEVDRHTQARHLREVDVMARDLVAVMTDADPSTIEVVVDVRMPDEVATHLARAAELRERSREAQAEAAAELRQAARRLRAAGMPLRDIGQLLDVSYQRAHQLVSS